MRADVDRGPGDRTIYALAVAGMNSNGVYDLTDSSEHEYRGIALGYVCTLNDERAETFNFPISDIVEVYRIHYAGSTFPNGAGCADILSGHSNRGYYDHWVSADI